MAATADVAVEPEPKTDSQRNMLLRRRILQRHGMLKMERSGWDVLCREVTEYLLPYHGRYEITDTNKGDKRNSKIIDSTATRSQRILSASMMSHANPQSQPWFSLTIEDTELAKFPRVKNWLFKATEITHKALYQSNAYETFHHGYNEEGAFGTSCAIMRPDFERVVHFYPVTNGRFWLAEDYKCQVNTCYREISMTVAQMVEEFGIKAVSDQVAWNHKHHQNLDARFPVLHAIEPRGDAERNRKRRDNVNKRWRSVYIEPAAPDDRVLRESGFDEFPVIAPRWSVSGGDVYGNGPGFDSIGHIKQLQLMADSEGKAIEYGVEPPLTGPTGTKERDVDRLPGGYTPSDQATPNGGIREMWKVNLDLDHLQISKLDVRQMIRECWFTDVFAMFLGLEGDRRTATEIDARKEEKLLLLGEVTSRQYREKQGPAILFVFSELLKGGALPPIPEELSGQNLSIQFESILAKAQKSIGATALERLMLFVGQLYPVKPEVADKIDFDWSIEQYSDRLGIDPESIVPGPQVALVRQQRAQAMAAKESAALLEQQANTAQKLGATPVAGGKTTALDAMGQT